MTRELPGITVKLISLALALMMLGEGVAAAQAPSPREAGIATGASLLAMSDAQLKSRLQDIRGMGATWIRVDFHWAQIQPRNYHEYKWGPYDRLATAARKSNLKILGTLGYTPKWARNVRCAALVKTEVDGQKCSPRSTEEFGRFARAAVIRYKKHGLHTWEIWNEPNLTGYWKTARPDNTLFVDPEAYARTANAAAREIRHHDSQAKIITGGMAPLAEPKFPVGMRQSDFLARLLPHLEPHLFDAIAIHPYTWPKLPTVAAEYNAFYTVDSGRPDYALRTVMQRNGWANKKIWATEFGASTKGLRIEGTPLRLGRPDHVTENKQAQIIQQGVDGWFKKANVGPIFVHADSDQWLQTRKNEGGFGLRRQDGTKKPSYDAFKKTIQQPTPQNSPQPKPQAKPQSPFVQNLFRLRL